MELKGNVKTLTENLMQLQVDIYVMSINHMVPILLDEKDDLLFYFSLIFSISVGVTKPEKHLVHQTHY